MPCTTAVVFSLSGNLAKWRHFYFLLIAPRGASTAVPPFMSKRPYTHNFHHLHPPPPQPPKRTQTAERRSGTSSSRNGGKWMLHAVWYMDDDDGGERTLRVSVRYTVACWCVLGLSEILRRACIVLWTKCFIYFLWRSHGVRPRYRTAESSSVEAGVIGSERAGGVRLRQAHSFTYFHIIIGIPQRQERGLGNIIISKTSPCSLFALRQFHGPRPSRQEFLHRANHL